MAVVEGMKQQGTKAKMTTGSERDEWKVSKTDKLHVAWYVQDVEVHYARQNRDINLLIILTWKMCELNVFRARSLFTIQPDLMYVE